VTSGRRGREAGRRSFAYIAAIYLTAFLAAVATLWPRHLAEEAMVRVAVVVDGAELFALADALAAEEVLRGPGQTSSGEAAGRAGDGGNEESPPTGVLDRLLVRLREAGVTGVGVYEWTLQDAADRGQVFLVTRATLEAMGSPLTSRIPEGTRRDALVVGWTEPADPWLVETLKEALPHVAVPLHPGEPVEVNGDEAAGEGEGQAWLLVRSSPAQIALGLHPGEVGAVQAAGLTVVPRLRGGSLETPDELDRRLQAAGGSRGIALGAEYGPIIFWGTSVAGYPGEVRLVGERLAQAGAAIGLVEFAPQQGFNELARLLGYRVVRVHSITDREMAAGMTPRVAVDRWLRAVRERQVRLLYVRFFLSGLGAAPLDQAGPGAIAAVVDSNLAYIERLTGALLEAGYGLGAPERVSGPPVSFFALALIALAAGVCAGGLAWTVLSWFDRGLLPAPSGAWTSRLAGSVTGREGADYSPTGVRLEPLKPYKPSQPSRPSRFVTPLIISDRRLAVASLAGAVFTLAVFAVLWLKGYTVLARQVISLLTAVAFPAASALIALDVSAAVAAKAAGRGAARETNVGYGPPGAVDVPPLGSRLIGALAGFGAAVAFTLLGAAYVAALLSDVRFLLKIEEFRGVKLAHVAPLAVLGVILVARLAGYASQASGGSAQGATARGQDTRVPANGAHVQAVDAIASAVDTTSETPAGSAEAYGMSRYGHGLWTRIAAATRYWLNRSIRLGELVFGLGIAVILWVYVMRTGNEGLPVPAVEVSLRNLLEERLIVRPRTKEFLLGHPALFLALTYWSSLAGGSRRRRFCAMSLAVLGAIGQISVVNTFAHAHSALAVSVMRTLYGVGLGLALGIAAVAAVEGGKRLKSLRRRRGTAARMAQSGQGMGKGVRTRPRVGD